MRPPIPWRPSPPNPLSTMTTPPRATEFIELTGSSQSSSVPPRTIWGRMKEGFANFWFTNSVTRFCCCVDPTVHREVMLRRKQHAAVSLALMYSLDYRGDASIIEATMNDVGEDGYRLFQDQVLVQAPPPTAPVAAAPVIPPPGPRRRVPAGLQRARPLLAAAPTTTLVVWQPPAFPPVVPVPPLAAPPAAVPAAGGPASPSTRRDLRAVKFVPRFAASVVVELRSRLGQLPVSVPGNRLIVEREALRLMRKYKVREVDAVAHLPSIIGCYFAEDVHYRVETSRSRMSRFQRWLLNEKSIEEPVFGPLA